MGNGRGRGSAKAKPLTDKATVRCCNGTSTDRKTARVMMKEYGCSGEKTYDEAFCHCKKAGLNICTQEQMKAGLTRGTGCMYDLTDNWLKGEAEPAECPEEKEAKKKSEEMQEKKKKDKEKEEEKEKKEN